MKIIIDIPDDVYESVKNGTYCGSLYEELKKAVEPKQGEWIDDDINSNEKYHFFKCSVCGGDVVPRCNFCPKIGRASCRERV